MRSSAQEVLSVAAIFLAGAATAWPIRCGDSNLDPEHTYPSFKPGQLRCYWRGRFQDFEVVLGRGAKAVSTGSRSRLFSTFPFSFRMSVNS
jgi:polyisoprenoid-binding protein YceI